MFLWESQWIPRWKGLTMTHEPNCWLHTTPPKLYVMPAVPVLDHPLLQNPFRISKLSDRMQCDSIHRCYHIQITDIQSPLVCHFGFTAPCTACLHQQEERTFPHFPSLKTNVSHFCTSPPPGKLERTARTAHAIQSCSKLIHRSKRRRASQQP